MPDIDSKDIKATVVSLKENGMMEIKEEGSEWQVANQKLFKDWVERNNSLIQDRDEWKEIAYELYNYYYLAQGHSGIIKRFQEKYYLEG